MKTTISPATVLIVDDTPHNISLLSAALIDEYTIKVATSGAEAIDICRSMAIDIILLDVMMPLMDGFETCRLLKEYPLTRSIPVIFVTARGEVKDESMGFDCGAVDYITKPISAAIVRARVRTHLAVYNQNRALECLVRERTIELEESRLEVLHLLGSAGEYRDNETGLHVVRVSSYARIIGQALDITEREAELLYSATALHDIGKIGIPDGILFKPGKLDNDEWKIMRTHSEIGCNIIGKNHKNSFLKAAASIALSHHERWDGHGYPNRLAGEDIPIFGRIAAIADVFDALTTERPYKKAWPLPDVVKEIESSSGGHFDPKIVEVFLRKLPEMTVVMQECADRD